MARTRTRLGVVPPITKPAMRAFPSAPVVSLRVEMLSNFSRTVRRSSLAPTKEAGAPEGRCEDRTTVAFSRWTEPATVDVPVATVMAPSAPAAPRPASAPELAITSTYDSPPAPTIVWATEEPLGSPAA